MKILLIIIDQVFLSMPPKDHHQSSKCKNGEKNGNKLGHNKNNSQRKLHQQIGMLPAKNQGLLNPGMQTEFNKKQNKHEKAIDMRKKGFSLQSKGKKFGLLFNTNKNFLQMKHRHFAQFYKECQPSQKHVYEVLGLEYKAKSHRNIRRTLRQLEQPKEQTPLPSKTTSQTEFITHKDQSNIDYLPAPYAILQDDIAAQKVYEQRPLFGSQDYKQGDSDSEEQDREEYQPEAIIARDAIQQPEVNRQIHRDQGQIEQVSQGESMRSEVQNPMSQDLFHLLPSALSSQTAPGTYQQSEIHIESVQNGTERLS